MNSETVAFTPGGVKIQCIPVDLLDDELLEGEEKFPLVIDSVSPTPGVETGTRSRTNLTIVDNDGLCVPVPKTHL